MIGKIFSLLCAVALLSSCGEYNKALKSTDYDYKFEFAKKAFENKKWAFVSDYARLYALVNYGGIYMDTDVEVIKSLDSFLKHDALNRNIVECI